MRILNNLDVFPFTNTFSLSQIICMSLAVKHLPAECDCLVFEANLNLQPAVGTRVSHIQFQPIYRINRQQTNLGCRQPRCVCFLLNETENFIQQTKELIIFTMCRDSVTHLESWLDTLIHQLPGCHSINRNRLSLSSLLQLRTYFPSPNTRILSCYSFQCLF